MNNRVRLLRKSLDRMSQEEFGKHIGISNTAVSKIEKGENNLTEQNILAICKEFNVNEEWLRTGNGEMFNKLSQSEETAAIVARIVSDTDNPLKADFLNTAAKLIDNDDCYHVIKASLLELVELMKNKTE